MSQSGGEAVRQYLIASVAEHGRTLCQDHRRVARLLTARFPERPWQVVSIHLAVREGAAADLADAADPAVPSMVFERLVRRLFEQTGLSTSSAAWGLASWCEALGRTPPDHNPRLRGAPRTVKLNRHMVTRPRGAPWNLRGHRRGLTGIDFRFDGAMIATCSLDRTVRLWDPRAGEQIRCLMGGHRDWVRAVAFSPDGKLLASAGDDGGIRLWDPESGERKYRLHGHEGWVRGLTWSPDGRIVVSGGRDGFVCLWEVSSLQPLARLGPFEGGVSRLAFDPQGQWLAVGRPGAVEIWDLETARLAQLIEISGARPVVAAGPENRLYIGDDRGASSFSISKGSVISRYDGHGGPVRAVAIHGNGKALVTAGSDRAVRLWHAIEGWEAHYFQFRQVRITGLAFHPGGHIGIAFSDGNAQMREMSRGGAA